MKNLVIIGAGTAGTTVANRMVRRLPAKEWAVTVIDPETIHLYQPGLLFLPFGAQDEHKMVRARERTLSKHVVWMREGVARIDAQAKRIQLAGGGQITYDMLVIASGTRIRPEMTEGLLEGYGRNTFDFYTLNGALALRDALDSFKGGRLVVNVVEMPIKCPVAPLEFLFLADAFFKDKGMRDAVELVYATPLDAAFTKPLAAERLGYLLEDKGIVVESEFMTGEVAGDKLVSYDERAVPFDLLVTVPTHSGAEFVEASGIGDELAFIPTDKHTLAAKDMQDVFVIGDATDLPSSKAGSVAHFQSEVLTDNLLSVIRGVEPLSTFDGHANCFVETGHGKAMLIDFNYDVEPLPGSFPMAGGPFSLLEESRANHLGKLLFRWVYWNGLLPARPIPIGHDMTMSGKKLPPDSNDRVEADAA